MALSNREKQQRWRERYIARRRRVARITTLLLRQSWNDEHFVKLGAELEKLMNPDAITALRRALKPKTHEEVQAIMDAREAAIERLWLKEHPGRIASEYRRGLRDTDSEGWQWRRA